MAKIDPGTVFCDWTVLGPSKDKLYYYTCRCKCGIVRDVRDTRLIHGESRSCGKHNKPVSQPALSARYLQVARNKYLGKTINGFYIKDVLRVSDDKSQKMSCVTVCPQCGKEFTTHLDRLPHIKKCATCNRDLGNKVHAIKNIVSVNGSNLSDIKGRINGTVNKNSKTGKNGVSLLKNGRYRAYINFQRKQYSLGFYDTIDEAVTARKKAEEVIYGNYLKANEGWEDALKQALEDHNNKSTSAKK